MKTIFMILIMFMLVFSVQVTKTITTDPKGNETTSIEQKVTVVSEKLVQVSNKMPEKAEDVKGWIDYIFNQITAIIGSVVALLGTLTILVNKIEKLGKVIPFLKFNKKSKEKK